jgi:hypothetical protein
MVSLMSAEGCGSDGGAGGESVSYASLNAFEVLARAAWLAIRFSEPLREEDRLEPFRLIAPQHYLIERGRRASSSIKPNRCSPIAPASCGRHH